MALHQGITQTQVGSKYIEGQKEMRERKEHSSTRDDMETENMSAAVSRQEHLRPTRDGEEHS